MDRLTQAPERALPLLRRSAGQRPGDAELVEPYLSGRAELFGRLEGQDVVAIVGAELKGGGVVRVTAIATADSQERRGLGRALLTELSQLPGVTRIEAETDDDAVGFYSACGFSVEPLGDQYPEVRRYAVTRDL